MTNPWRRTDRPLAISHRGHSVEYPENTRIAFEKAIELGAEMIECDVNITRDGMLIMVDDDRMPMKEGETPRMEMVRFRSLGCYPLSGALRSTASDLTSVIEEMLVSRTSERQSRAIDFDQAAAMEKRKREGYF